jgi:hypothetical protein
MERRSKWQKTEWNGNLLQGSGQVRLETGYLSNSTTAVRPRVTAKPEELPGAPHAGRLSMALALELAKMGLP